jgi:hypothetical protein
MKRYNAVMSLTFLTRAFSTCVALSLTLAALPSSLLAQSGTTLPTVPITIEQKNSEGIISNWTLLSQLQQEYIGNEPQQQVSIPSGNYTFFVTQPQGYTAQVVLYRGELVVTTVDSPQLSFVFNGETNLRIVAKLTLANIGQVGVLSNPTGISFRLGGPNQMVKEGVTPMDYQNMPIGQYNVIYKPNGCPQTPARSDELKKDGRVSFNITLICSALSSASVASAQSTAGPAAFPFVTVTAADGSWLMFRDVPLEAWFADFVKGVAEKGIMSGYKDEEGKPTDFFGPENWVTLEEVAAGVERAAGIPQSGAATENWYVEEWAAPFIAAAEQLDWKVYRDPERDITEQATRAEVVSTILQAFDVPLRWPKGNIFNDVGRRDEYAAEIETAAALGIVTGRKDESGVLTGSFDPEGWINRAEMSKILSLAIGKLKSTSSHSSASSSKASVHSSSSSRSSLRSSSAAVTYSSSVASSSSLPSSSSAASSLSSSTPPASSSTAAVSSAAAASSSQAAAASSSDASS